MGAGGAQSQVRGRLAVLTGGPPVQGWVPDRPVDAGADGGAGAGGRADAHGCAGRGGPSSGHPDGDAPDGRDDDLGTLQARALASAVEVYTAAHGHPLEAEPFADGVAGGRWATRGRVAVVAAVALVALGAVVVVRSVQQTPSVVVPVTGGVTDAVAVTEGPEVVVHVVGQVLTPGLVRLPEGSRLADAIDAAGGAGPEADLAAVNLARVLTDGEQVVVPRPGEPPVGEAAGVAAGGVVDLNIAGAGELDGLPGIGPVLAERIVDWRDEHGRFTVVDELTEVSGIGPSLLDGVRDLVRVG